MPNWNIDETPYPGPPEQREQVFQAKSVQIVDKFGNIIASAPFSSAPMKSGDTLTFTNIEVKISGG